MAMMLTMSNVRSGSKVLVVDGMHGLLTAGVLEKLGDKGLIVSFHSTEGPSAAQMTHLNFPQSMIDLVHHISWSKIYKDIDAEKAALRASKEPVVQRHLANHLHNLDVIEQCKTLLAETKFDA